jgi:hypothetical protein
MSYILSDGHEEVFLHKKEATEPYQPGMKIRVFLYRDNLGRITASTKQPFISLGKAAFLFVVDVNPSLGVFLDNNLVKDLLCSKDDLPPSPTEWPIAGDRLFVTLKEKKGQLFAKPIPRKQISLYFSEPPSLTVEKTYSAWVQSIMDVGIVAFTENGEEIFVHINNIRQTIRLGQEVKPKILKLTETNEYVGTLIEQKEIMLQKDSLSILAYLDAHQGVMPYTDKSDPNAIQRIFKMSKAAFKRALGALYKSGYVMLDPEQTRKIKS